MPRPLTGIVKGIGHRQMYDILQSRKPRATRGALWVFGSRLVVGAARLLAGYAPVDANMAAGGDFERRCCPGSGLEMSVRTVGGVACASVIIAGSTRGAACDEVVPCRIMTR